MNHRRFDNLARSLRNLPRRRLLGGLGAAGLAGGLASALGRRTATAQFSKDDGPQSINVTCRPCNCDEDGENCQCCLNGITGGGIVRTETGDATLVLFATELGDEVERQASGFVRWIDLNTEGGVTLESVGPIAYEWELEDAQAREIRGTMSVNGEFEEPFVLHLVDVGTGAEGGDTARLEVGNLAAAEVAEAEGFGYAAEGLVVGGDIQLLDNVTPVG